MMMATLTLMISRLTESKLLLHHLCLCLPHHLPAHLEVTLKFSLANDFLTSLKTFQEMLAALHLALQPHLLLPARHHLHHHPLSSR